MSYADSAPPRKPEDTSRSVAEAKARMRQAVRQRLKDLTPEQRQRDSERVCERLRQQEVWHKSTAILAYAPLANELDISCLVEEALAANKTVALPRFDSLTRRYTVCAVTVPLHQLSPGNFGIREPEPSSPTLPLKQLDFMLVPGVAFDRNGRRLGRGRGYYDLLLENAPGIKCGVGFDEQVQAQIPVEAHDVLLDCIVTPGFWLDVRLRRSDDVVG